MNPSRLRTWALGIFDRLFDIKPAEFSRVQTFFLFLTTTSIFYTMSATVGDTLFLSRFGSERAERLLPWVYVGMGLVTAAMTWLYERVEERIPRERFVIGVNLALAVSLVVFRWAIRSDQLWLYYALVIWLEACALVALMVFFSFAGDYFTSREARRLYGYINGGIAVGSIIGGWSVDWLVSRIGDDNLLYICAGLLACGALWCLAIAALAKPVASDEEEDSRVPLKAVLSDRFLRIVIVLVLASQAYGWLVDYQLKIVASREFQEEALAVFFGKFYGWLGVVQFLVQFGLIGWLLRRFGVVKSLLVLPALLLLANGAFFLHPVFMVAAAGNFIRLTFLETLDEPGQELLFLPLASRLRVRAQSFVEGMVLPFGITLSGLIILVLARFCHDVRQIALAGMLPGLAWLGSVVILLPRYREALAASLRKFGMDELDLSGLLSGAEGIKTVGDWLRSGQPEQQTFALDLWGGRPLGALAEPVGALAASPHEAVAVKALRALAADRTGVGGAAVARALDDARPAVRAAAISAQFGVDPGAAVDRVKDWLSDDEPSVRVAVLTGCLLNRERSGANLALSLLTMLLESQRVQDRLIGAKVLAQVGNKGGSFRKRLLNDPVVEVRREIVAAATGFPEAELVPWLVEQLKEPGLRTLASEALEGMPLSAVPNFIESIAETRRPMVDRALLVRILGNFGGLRGAKVLWEILSSNEDVMLRVAAAETLLRMRSRNGAHDISRHQDFGFLDERLDELSLINLAREEAGDSDPFFRQILFDHARLEVKAVLYALALRHGEHGIGRIEASLFGGSASQVSNALEIIEVVFPHETASRVAAVVGPLVTQNASGGGGLKSDTIERLMKAPPWLRVIARHHVEAQGMKADGGGKMSGAELHMYKMMSRISFLSKVRFFEGVSANYLMSLAKIMRERTFCDGEVLFSEGAKADSFYLICEGNLRLRVGEREVARLGPRESVGEMALVTDQPYSATASAEGDLRVLRISSDEFNNVLFTHPEITVALLRHTSVRLRECMSRAGADER